MRLNFVVVIFIIAALAASGFFAINYFQDSTSADNLQKQIETTNTKVQEVTASTGSLTAEIEALKASQAEIQAALVTESPVPIDKPDPTQVIRSVMDLGVKYSLTIIPLSASDWSNVKVQQGSYEVFRMNFKIDGTEKQLVDFVRELPDLYPVVVIESFSITPVKVGGTAAAPASPPAPAPGEQTYSSNLSIAVYAR